jgi:hypothetical protein
MTRDKVGGDAVFFVTHHVSRVTLLLAQKFYHRFRARVYP